MAENEIKSTKLLALATSQAALFADEFVSEPITELELRIKRDSTTGQKAPAAYSLGRDQALTRGRSGYPFVRRSKTDLNDSNVGSGETSAQLLARRLR